MLYDVLKNPFSSACFVIGPEGGFAPGEAERLEEKGFALCSLGTGILRAETAACFVLSAAQYQLQANAAKDGSSAL
ncbi:RsmE family RNA methyltransferase [Allobaculum sp. Allo2]|nr:RsmE family RNA methyltransferase [Allobaculum sp. Allo2]UNT92503.1 RsmE family RNA methyltransferase [Allobaculum sp. Allo2]